MPEKPKRIQLRRTKGWRKPEGAVVVSRPSKWGNPFRVMAHGEHWRVLALDHRGKPIWHITWATRQDARASAVRLYRKWLVNDGSQPGQIRDEGGAFVAQMAREELRGKDLACWCPLDKPCHADVLLEVANG